MDIIKVSATSRTSAVAGAIAGVIREHNKAEVQAIGAGAVNQAVKALILANGYLKEEGIHVACIPEFVDVEIEDKVRTAVRLVIEPMLVDTSETSVIPEEISEIPAESSVVTEETPIFPVETSVVTEEPSALSDDPTVIPTEPSMMSEETPLIPDETSSGPEEPSISTDTPPEDIF